MEKHNQFRIRIRELREANGYKSQQSFANALGIAQSTVGNWESGSREPDFDRILQLADFFRISVDSLLGRDSSDIAPPSFQRSPAETLSSEERDLLSYYRQVNINGRRYITMQAKFASQQGEYANPSHSSTNVG